MKTTLKRIIKKLTKPFRPIKTLTEEDLLVERLADKLMRNRGIFLHGKGPKYWKSQAKLAFDFLKDNHESMQ